MNYMTGCISRVDELYSNTYGVQLEKQQFAYFFLILFFNLIFKTPTAFGLLIKTNIGEWWNLVTITV